MNGWLVLFVYSIGFIVSFSLAVRGQIRAEHQRFPTSSIDNDDVFFFCFLAALFALFWPISIPGRMLFEIPRRWVTEIIEEEKQKNDPAPRSPRNDGPMNRY